MTTVSQAPHNDLQLHFPPTVAYDWWEYSRTVPSLSSMKKHFMRTEISCVPRMTLGVATVLVRGDL
jgi:hypothetical protein